MNRRDCIQTFVAIAVCGPTAVATCDTMTPAEKWWKEYWCRTRRLWLPFYGNVYLTLGPVCLEDRSYSYIVSADNDGIDVLKSGTTDMSPHGLEKWLMFHEDFGTPKEFFDDDDKFLTQLGHKPTCPVFDHYETRICMCGLWPTGTTYSDWYVKNVMPPKLETV